MGFFKKFKDAWSAEAKKEGREGMFTDTPPSFGFIATYWISLLVTIPFVAAFGLIGYAAVGTSALIVGAAVGYLAYKPVINAFRAAFKAEFDIANIANISPDLGSFSRHVAKATVNAFAIPAKICVRAFNTAVSSKAASAQSPPVVPNSHQPKV